LEQEQHTHQDQVPLDVDQIQVLQEQLQLLQQVVDLVQQMIMEMQVDPAVQVEQIEVDQVELVIHLL
jgi:hypothetical protein